MPDCGKGMAQVAYPCLSPRMDPRKRRPRHSTGPILCAVHGCGAEIETKYLRRFRLCQEHIRSLVLLCGDEELRFCQQCNKLEPVEKFSGDQRNCRRSLANRSKGTKATGKKVPGRAKAGSLHSRDPDSDGDLSTYLNRDIPQCAVDSALAPGTMDVCMEDVDLASNMKQQRSRDRKDIDSAHTDSGNAGMRGNGSPTSVTQNAWRKVEEVRHPVFVRSDSISSRYEPDYDQESADVQVPHVFNDDEISEKDLPLHLCRCGVCSICTNAEDMALGGSGCLPYDCPSGVVQPVAPAHLAAGKPAMAYGSEPCIESGMWQAPVAPEFRDPLSEWLELQKMALPSLEGNSVTAPVDPDPNPIYPIPVDVDRPSQALDHWATVDPTVPRDGLSQYPGQWQPTGPHPNIPIQGALLCSTPASPPPTAGPNFHFASPHVENAQFGQVPRGCAHVATRPPARYAPGALDAVNPSLICAQRRVHPSQLAVEEQIMPQANDVLAIPQRMDRPMSVLRQRRMQLEAQMAPQTSPQGLSNDPFAFAMAATQQAPQQRPSNWQFHRRSIKMPEGSHTPPLDLLEVLGPVAANGHLTANARALAGCVRVVVNVAAGDSGLCGSTRRHAVVTAGSHAMVPDVSEVGSPLHTEYVPMCEEIPQREEEEEITALEQMASQLPRAEEQRLATANCWIQTEHHLGHVVSGGFQQQWDVAEPLRGFDILSVHPACFMASQGSDVQILGRGLGQPARVLCSFGSETRLLNLSLTRIRVGWAGEVEIIESRNAGQAATVDVSEALALVARARGEVEVGDVLEIWSGRVRAFHGVGVGYLEAEMGHLLTNPMPILLADDVGMLKDMEALEKEVEECRMSVEELQQIREDVGHVLSHLEAANHEMAATMRQEDDKIDLHVRPWNDQANPEYRSMMVNLANWHVGNFCRRGLPALMRAVLPAALLSGAGFATLAKSEFSDGWTLLHIAVMSHSVEMVSTLMELGEEHGYTWRWDICGPMGLTPLHMLAVDINGAAMLKFVVSVEPDVSTMWFELSLSNGETPERFAQRAGQPNLNEFAEGHRAECRRSYESQSDSTSESRFVEDVQQPQLINAVPRGKSAAQEKDRCPECRGPCMLQAPTPAMSSPLWTCTLKFTDPAQETRFKGYCGQNLSGMDGLAVFLYMTCCVYILLMIELGNFKQPTKALWRQEGVLPYALALLPLGLPLLSNWLLQSFAWYHRWRENFHIVGSLTSMAVSIYFGVGPMQWFLSRWSNNLFAIGFVACRMSFKPQVRLCHKLQLHFAELAVALVSALRHGVLIQAFAECFCMILAMVVDMAWTYFEEKQSRLYFLNNKLQLDCQGKSKYKMA